MNMSDVYCVQKINIYNGDIDLDLINARTHETFSVRLNIKQPPQTIIPAIKTLKTTEDDIICDNSKYYNYSFNVLHNGQLGDPIQLASMKEEDLFIVGKVISIPTQLQQIYEFEEVKG